MRFRRILTVRAPDFGSPARRMMRKKKRRIQTLSIASLHSSLNQISKAGGRGTVEPYYWQDATILKEKTAGLNFPQITLPIPCYRVDTSTLTCLPSPCYDMNVNRTSTCRLYPRLRGLPNIRIPIPKKWKKNRLWPCCSGGYGKMGGILPLSMELLLLPLGKLSKPNLW